MKKIWLTGGSGFVGNAIYNHLAKTYQVLKPRSVLDLCDSRGVEEYFIKHRPDIIVHSAAVGTGRNQRNEPGVFDTNVRMFNTLEKYIPLVEKFINIDSGASFNTNKSIRRESIYDDHFPEDEYGKSKLHIAKSVLDYPNAINLRLYGCFGIMDYRDRFMSQCMINAVKGLDIHVYNMFMDYFYVMDVPIVIDHCILNDVPQDIDLVYGSSGLVALDNIAREIRYLMPKKTGALHVDDGRMPFYYCGNPDNLNALDIKLNGLMNGIINTASYYIRQWLL